MGMDVQDKWNQIRNSRLSCGKNAVFVEYNFDAAHEYKSDLIKFQRIVTWIVYVVTKVSDLKFLTFFCSRFRIYIWEYHVMLGYLAPVTFEDIIESFALILCNMTLV